MQAVISVTINGVDGVPEEQTFILKPGKPIIAGEKIIRAATNLKIELIQAQGDQDESNQSN